MIDKDKIAKSASVYGEHAGQFIRLTLKDAGNFFQEIKDSIASGDADGLKIAAHSLKSIMRQAGADDIADFAAVLEEKGRNNACADAVEDLSRMEGVFFETVAAMQELA